MDVWEYRHIIAFVTTPVVLVIFYFALRVQRWKFSEEVHLSKFDQMFIKAKYFIGGTFFGMVTASFLIIIGWFK